MRICIRPLHGAFVLLAIMDIRAPDLILGKALRGRLGHQITDATAIVQILRFPLKNTDEYSSNISEEYFLRYLFQKYSWR